MKSCSVLATSLSRIDQYDDKIPPGHGAVIVVVVAEVTVVVVSVRWLELVDATVAVTDVAVLSSVVKVAVTVEVLVLVSVSVAVVVVVVAASGMVLVTTATLTFDEASPPVDDGFVTFAEEDVLCVGRSNSFSSELSSEPEPPSSMPLPTKPLASKSLTTPESTVQPPQSAGHVVRKKSCSQYRTSTSHAGLVSTALSHGGSALPPP
jgi:hypothetical protein